MTQEATTVAAAIACWVDVDEQVELEIETAAGKWHFSVAAGERGLRRLGAIGAALGTDTLGLRARCSGPRGERNLVQRFACIDVSRLTRALYEAGPWRERIASFLADLNAWLDEEGCAGEVHFELEVGSHNVAGDGPADRLMPCGSPWPEDLQALWKENVRFGDSMIGGEILRPALSLMEGWDGQPRDLLDEVPELRALYARSLVLYRHCGDGIGYLCWDPDQDCCFWTHQETVFSPIQLRAPDASVLPRDAAISACLVAFELRPLADLLTPGAYDQVLFDPLHPAPALILHLGETPRLHFASLGDSWAFALMERWTSP